MIAKTFIQKTHAAIFLLFIAAYFTWCQSTPLNNLYDTEIIHTVYGTDKFYKQKDITDITLNLSPFYAHTCTAKNGKSKKVAAGDRLGKWQMLGIFYGEGAKPVSQQTPLRDFLKQQLNTLFTNAGYPNFFEDNPIPNQFAPCDPNQADVNDPSSYTNPAYFGFYDATIVNYEKYGLRGQLTFDIKSWIGVKVKSGFAEIKNKANFIINRPQPTIPGPTNQLNTLNAQVITLLLAPQEREDLAEELDLDLTGFCRSGLEDTHAQLYFNLPTKLKDSDGDVVCTFAPHFSIGAWIPTGWDSNPNKAFSVPSGNNGHRAVTIEAALNFDFPRSVQPSFGAGLLIADRKVYDNYRVPSSENQSGIIPWQTAIAIRPGITWYGNASFKAEDFLQGLSVYFDYIYTQHSRDHINLEDCSNDARQAAFIAGDGVQRLIEESCWRHQQANISIAYRINRNIMFGFGVQAHITGTRVYRPTTSIGTISLTF